MGIMEKKMENTIMKYMGVSQNWGYLFGGPYNKDYSILGSILGSPYFGKLPFSSLGSSLGFRIRKLLHHTFQNLPCPCDQLPMLQTLTYIPEFWEDLEGRASDMLPYTTLE